jgi:hypothetical protein
MQINSSGKIGIVRNNLTSWYYGKQTEVAVVGCFENNRLSLVLVPCSDFEQDDPYLAQSLTPYFAIEQGYTDHILGSNYANGPLDEIYVFVGQGGTWKFSWLADQGIATDTGRTNDDFGYPFHVFKLSKSFYEECVRMLDLPLIST